MARVRMEFSVLGLGAFPLEMLHHEGAFPATEGDADIILRSVLDAVAATAAPEHAPLPPGLVQDVRLAAYHEPGWHPDFDRWVKTGWQACRMAAPVPARRSALGLWL